MLNYTHSFSFLPDRLFENVLSVGGNYGDELKPIRNKIRNITIMVSSIAFSKSIIEDRINYVKSQLAGKIPFDDNTFDLITCFGTLHHIANVTTLTNEMYRCVKRGVVCVYS